MKREEAESSINEEDAEFDSLLQNITEEWDETSASHDGQLKQKLKKTETVGAMEKLWRLSLKLEKENTEMKIQGANETMTQKPWYILKVTLNKKVILNKKDLN